MNLKFDIVVSSASKSELLNAQTERNAEIKYDKDTRKIQNNSSIHGRYIVFCKGKPTVFGTAFNREPGFKIGNLIKYRIQCRHYVWSLCVCVGGGLQHILVPPYFGRL